VTAEALVVVGVVVVVAVIVLIAMTLVGIGLRRSAEFFLAPPQPAGLARIVAIIENRRTEAEAAVAGGSDQAVPEMLLFLRAFTGKDRAVAQRPRL
jgi:hypothetical protein